MEMFHFNVKLNFYIKYSLKQICSTPFVQAYSSLDMELVKSWEKSSLRHPEIYKNPQVLSGKSWDTQEPASSLKGPEKHKLSVRGKV